MKKIAVTAALAAIATVTISAHAATTGANGGSTTASTNITLTAGTGAGAGLKENVTLQLSSGNVASVVYDDVQVAYGYSVGSSKGKGTAFRGSSKGGAITDKLADGTTPIRTTPATAGSDLDAAATASASGT